VSFTSSWLRRGHAGRLRRQRWRHRPICRQVRWRRHAGGDDPGLHLQAGHHQRAQGRHGHPHHRDSTPHTATSKEPGVFESGSIDTGKSGKVKLEETGSFAYYCAFHPFMKGTIVVE
jgi:hypothetical protein